MQLRKGDILIALKAINLTQGIGNRDRRVAAALLDHVNRKTGQCDPSIKRLSGLLGISERTVFRSLQRIEADRLFKRVRHGGHLNRNSYEPNWPRFREIEAIWSARMKPQRATMTDLSAGSGQECQLGPDAAVTQTCRINLSKETCSRGLPKKASAKPTTRNPERLSVQPGRRSAEAARAAAERRWSNDLHRRYAATPTIYGTVVEAITPAMREGATDAELHQRGGGLVYLTAALPRESQP